MSEWAELSKELQELLRLRTYPLAFKRCKSATELESIPKMHRLKNKPTFCQILTLARTTGWTIGVTGEEVFNCHFPQRAGLLPIPEDGWKRRVGTWVSNVEDGKRCFDAYYTIPGSCEALVLGTLASAAIEPEVVVIYGSPAQMAMLKQGLDRVHYERLEFTFMGESSCMDAIHRCYVTGKASLSIPCYGERWLGGAEEDELDIALPPDMVETAIKGLKELAAIGFTYPIHRMGTGADPWQTAMSRVYGQGGISAREKGISCWE